MTKPTENTPDRLQKLQDSFAAHIRDPKNNAAPDGIEDRRMKIYRELFFNNIQSLLASNFPVLRALYGENGWKKLIREFYSEHRCQTPLFPEVAKEFLRYLQDGRESGPEDPGFLLELAHYEWVELALSIDEREIEDIPAKSVGNLLDETPVLSPLAWPLSYRYPVHRIKPGYQPTEPPEEATHLLVYRNRDGAVKFMQLNDVSRLLLEFMQKNSGAAGRQLLLQVSEAIGHPDPAQVISAGKQLLEDWNRKDILLGTRG
ncbi:MAG: putative DNA-binding domain-containing protein [Gammaproteobacteria bacterium]|nr:putative DNA-binding domain-containing protein [Gammaproteobacteria bacterium]